jgi:DNA polymerase III subunit epsilon
MPDHPWTDASLLALDLEGTGAQDREHEAILEIATVPLAGGLPDMPRAFETLINPGRPVPRRPWISPGLTDDVLRDAPPPETIGPELAARINDSYLVGHNIGVDWRLLHRHYPEVRVRGLIDTLKLAKRGTAKSRSLTTLIDHYALTERVSELVPEGRPHRALWDTVAAAVLLSALIEEHWPQPPSLAALLADAEYQASDQQRKGTYEQQTLM